MLKSNIDLAQVKKALANLERKFSIAANNIAALQLQQEAMTAISAILQTEFEFQELSIMQPNRNADTAQRSATPPTMPDNPNEQIVDNGVINVVKIVEAAPEIKEATHTPMGNRINHPDKPITL